MRIATRQSVILFLDRQIEKTMDFQNLTFVIRLMYISFSVALTRRVSANEAVCSFSNAFGAENGDASQTEVSLRGAIREDRDVAIRSFFLTDREKQRDAIYFTFVKRLLSIRSAVR